MDNIGELHVTKDCSAYTGAAGAYCTITSSNLAAIKAGSKIFYDQAAGTPPGLLDSDIILDAGTGNRAFGHCTVESEDRSRTVHVLRRDRAVRRVPCPCRCLAGSGCQPVVTAGTGRTASVRSLSDKGRSDYSGRRLAVAARLTESESGTDSAGRCGARTRRRREIGPGAPVASILRAPGRPAISCSERNPPGGIAGNILPGGSGTM